MINDSNSQWHCLYFTLTQYLVDNFSWSMYDRHTRTQTNTQTDRNVQTEVFKRFRFLLGAGFEATFFVEKKSIFSFSRLLLHQTFSSSLLRGHCLGLVYFILCYFHIKIFSVFVKKKLFCSFQVDFLETRYHVLFCLFPQISRYKSVDICVFFSTCHNYKQQFYVNKLS